MILEHEPDRAAAEGSEVFGRQRERVHVPQAHTTARRRVERPQDVEQR
jgi:hypothetical protein